MKRILSIVPSDNLNGGAEKNISHILNGFSNSNYHVILIIWYQTPIKTCEWQRLYPHYEFYTVEQKGLLGLFKLIILLNSLSKLNIDLTFISNITFASIVGLLRRLRIFKTSYFLVRDPSSPFLRYKSKLKLLSYKLRYWLGYGSVDYLIFQTDLIKNAFYKNINFRTPSVVIGNPIDLKMIKSLAEEDISMKSKPFIVACGRLIYEKGFDLLIDAFASNLDLVNDFNLLILGDGPLKDKLLKQIQDRGLQNNVFLKGFVTNPMPYFKKASCCVVSSRSEGFPNVLYQMLALNKKVLITNCCGGLDKVPGIKVIKPNSVEELSNGLESLVYHTIKVENSNSVERYLISQSIENYMNKIFNIINIK